MSTIRVSPLLRFGLLLDAAISGAVGALMLVATGVLHNITALPEPLLRYVGMLFIPYVLLVGWLGLRETLRRGAVWAVIAGNLGWSIASILLLTSGSLAHTRSAWRM